MLLVSYVKYRIIACNVMMKRHYDTGVMKHGPNYASFHKDGKGKDKTLGKDHFY